MLVHIIEAKGFFPGNATNQTIDYKGFVDNEMWIVIDDSAVMGSTYLTFYTDNPDTNPNAPIAEQVTFG